MKYTQKTFTLPAAPQGVSQRQWDRATLAPQEFAAKYGPSVGLYPASYPNGCPILSDK